MEALERATHSWSPEQLESYTTSFRKKLCKQSKQPNKRCGWTPPLSCNVERSGNVSDESKLSAQKNAMNICAVCFCFCSLLFSDSSGSTVLTPPGRSELCHSWRWDTRPIKTQYVHRHIDSRPLGGGCLRCSDEEEESLFLAQLSHVLWQFYRCYGQMQKKK